MSNFAVITHELTIEPHPDADALECARIGGYYTVVQKGQFQTGDVAAYIPEAAVLPQALIDELGLTNHLAGPEHNRVHAVRLRGVLSQGLVLPMPGAVAGTDVTDRLGITKYVPVIPPHLQGEMTESFGNLIRYEIDDIKMHPAMFTDGEPVVITEKLHGTWCCLGTQDGSALVTSKQLSAQGLVFVTDPGHNDDNVYVQTHRRSAANLAALQQRVGAANVLVLGEVFGHDIQDLQYNRSDHEFRAFDIYVGDKESGHFLDYDLFAEATDGLFDCVPELYRGPFSREIMLEHTSGRSSLAKHNREGIVIKPAIERGHPTIDRVIAKSLNEKHLLRKGATEYN